MLGMNQSKQITPDQALLKMLIGILFSWFLTAVLLLAGAGRLDWGLGWLFISVWGLLKVALVFLLRWHDPALMVERVTHHKNTPRYERWIVPLYLIFFLWYDFFGRAGRWKIPMVSGGACIGYYHRLCDLPAGQPARLLVSKCQPVLFFRIPLADGTIPESNPIWTLLFHSPSCLPGSNLIVAGDRPDAGILVFNHPWSPGSDDHVHSYNP